MTEAPALRKGENQLLAALSPDELRAVLPEMELVRLELREIVYRPGTRISHVYFPLNSMLSIATPHHNGTAVEAATIGNEGMTGVPVSLPGAVLPLSMTCRIAGDSIRLTTPAYLTWLDKTPGVRDLMDRHSHVVLARVAQNSFCSKQCTMEQRCARWLLLSQDRARNTTFSMTHESLAGLLGVRRASVSVAAMSLQLQGAVRYHRGHMEVLDRSLLQSLSCECYEVAQKHQAGLMKRKP